MSDGSKYMPKPYSAVFAYTEWLLLITKYDIQIEPW